MSFNQSGLAAAIQAIQETSEYSARVAWGFALVTYFDACVTSDGVPWTTSPTSRLVVNVAARNAMEGFSDPDLGAQRIQDGFAAFWARMALSPSFFFSGATAITAPSGITTIAANIQADVFTPNESETTLTPAIDRLVAFLHAHNAGGTATIGGGARTIT